MRKSYHKEISYLLQENSFSSSNTAAEKRSIKCQSSGINTSNTFLKAGIHAINSEKKYSLLKVPKTPTKFFNMCKDTKTPTLPASNLTPVSNCTPILMTARPDTKTSSSRYSALTSYRLRKNPNQENLKIALVEILKTPKKIPEIKVKSEENIQIHKSDIEKLMESQKSSHFDSTRLNKPTLRLDYINQGKARHKKNDSQASDPSPVREKENNISFKRPSSSQRTKNTHLKSFEGLNKVKIQKTRPVLKKMMTEESLSSDPSSSSDVSIRIFDYKQESFKILKNTSSFANKIMKGIRHYSRKKDY
jgi:hypothetical protein